MRALQISAINQLAVTDVPDPALAPGDVLVGVKAASLNHRDIWIKRGEYAGIKYPCIPGSDGAGVVLATGEGVDPAWAGRSVIVNPTFDWGAHERAQSPAFSILGLPRPGMMAEKIAVPVGQLALKPEHLSWEEAAALPLAAVTAFRAIMTRAELTGNERVLISGIGGGVAVFALQFAVAHGAAVWVTSSSEEKIARAVALGARGGINYTKAGWAKEAGQAVGRFDVIVDSAGGDGFEQLVDLAAPGARLVFYGATRGNPAGLPMRKIFWRQLSLLGTTMGSPADWDAMTKFVALHRIKPIVSDVVAFAQVVDAFHLMQSAARFGKIVVRM